MATMSIGKAWEEAVAFVQRESSLLFPVALLFIALPSIILGEMTPPELTAWAASQPRGALPPIPATYVLAMLLTAVLIWFGSLALFALALRPGISVGEALRLSLARLPVLIGTSFLAGGAIALAMLLLALVGMVIAAASPALLAPLLAAAMVGGLAFVGVRLVLLNPVVIDGQDGVVASLKRSWRLTKGHFWHLFGLIAVLTLLSLVASTAAQAVFGILGRVLVGADGARLIGGVVAAAVSTVVQVYMLVMLARLYRQAVAG
ncbi:MULTISPECIES: glycerophosphoryl diester phosphodiesterase membrane domain-containing protein [Sphingobium]|uniref:Membrane protein n=1 Tax=Sphingobium chungbukense TaxID=56193 RepID=A0A0M3AU89_9SPHN|nr:MULTISPECIES: glycerophosphoryl diester phosphodiesterase membrane domain-containing protein [Sphingobium]KKW93458.1 membrane protein [Sphingobium chungbukense]PJG47934.1 hypothetical protein CAF53_06515 [Sphingobium sp. LB126]